MNESDRSMHERYSAAAEPWRLPFPDLVSLVQPRDDDELAALVDHYGRDRIENRLGVDVSMFLRAIERLADRRVVLDAAIDMSIRSASGGDELSPDAIDALRRDYPQFNQAIDDAVQLHAALVSTTGTPAAMGYARDWTLPRSFGPRLRDGRSQFELTELIGEGAWAQLFLAIDRNLSDADSSAYVAVKVLRAGILDESAARLFADEATKARRVRHANVVGVLQRGTTDEGDSFIVYEHVTSGDLETWRASHAEAITATEAVRIASQIARGVQAAHFAGVVHCDLKPRNIVMTERGDPKIIDFGVSQRLVHESETRPNDRPSLGRMGTLGFMAPEQYLMQDGSDAPAVDLYALGGILYWLLTGRVPNGASASEAAERMSREEPFTDDDLSLVSDPVLRRIIRRCLRRSPAERYASPSAFADDLDAWREHRPIAWMRPSVPQRAALFARRNPWLVGLSAIVLVSAIAITLTVRNANRHEREARQAQDTAQELQGRTTKITESIKFAAQQFQRLAIGGRFFEVLQFTWTLEYLAHAGVFSHPSDVERMWAVRQVAYEERIKRWHAGGYTDDVHLMCLELQQGFWLIRDREPYRATSVLAGVRARFAALGSFTRFYTRLADMVLASALAAEVICSDASGWSRDDLEQLAAHLEDCLNDLGGYFDRGQAYQMGEEQLDSLRALREQLP